MFSRQWELADGKNSSIVTLYLVHLSPQLNLYSPALKTGYLGGTIASNCIIFKMLKFETIWISQQGTRALNVRIQVFVGESTNIAQGNINHFR